MGAIFFSASRSKSATDFGGTESRSASKPSSFEELARRRRSADQENTNDTAATAVETAATFTATVKEVLFELRLMSMVKERGLLVKES